MVLVEAENDGAGAALRSAVASYCAERRHPNLPPFKVYQHTRTSWHRTPESGSAGCYAAYAVDGALLYIGKASHRKRIGDRLLMHFQMTQPPWVERVVHVFFVPTGEPFEAPSLEEYLIHKLRPVFDAIGRRSD